jgi:3',5'-nucleoside bisphosphate phosphatase
MMIDLHTHTNQSDGSLPPKDLVRKARTLGLEAVAVTDHDTVGGVDEAVAEGFLTGVRVIPGVELSVEWETGPLHILGYFIDCKERGLLATLDIQRNRRKERLAAILEKLASLDAHLSYEDVMAAAPGGVPGKPHIAELLVRNGYASDENRARKEFLDKGGLAYVPKTKLLPEEAIEVILAAGGTPALAHPFSAFRGLNELFAVCLVRFKEAGLRALEVYYPSHTAQEAEYYETKALEHNLAMTGGSDFHGKGKPEVRLGAVWNGRPLPYRFLTFLENHRP